MSDDSALTLAALEAQLASLAQQRYGGASGADVPALAAQAADGEYLLLHARCLEGRLAAVDDVSWIASTRNTPAEALQRIKALCTLFPDLFSAMFVVSATHATVAREILAVAIKQFRRDTDALSNEDMVSLLISIHNGGAQSFEAVLRTRKSADRKAAALPWGKDTD